MKHFKTIALIFSLFALIRQDLQAQNKLFTETVKGRWTTEKANNWYASQPWLVGCNYLPATAINQIEMWQASTWDPKTIDKELGLAESIGMNTLRVFLHDLVWANDEKGLYNRMNEFLIIAQKHKIKPFFVFFDDCHFPKPHLGVQPPPVARYHNSGWVNSPGRALALKFAEDTATPAEISNLKGYVQQTINHFKNDDRVLMWELYNEPGRHKSEDNVTFTTPMGDKSNKLLHDAWVWAREINPQQPITATAEGSVGENNIQISLNNSDVYSIHSYSSALAMDSLIREYKSYGRPVMMTEWLARTNNKTVEDCLPVLKKYKVAAVNWGLVAGKSGTVWPWSSRRNTDGTNISVKEKRAKGEIIKPGEPFPEPEIWFHDLFRTDGTPFSKKEIAIFKALTNGNLNE